MSSKSKCESFRWELFLKDYPDKKRKTSKSIDIEDYPLGGEGAKK